jgi:hypothetical protein
MGSATSEDEEILKEFYYRHFEVTDDSLALLREKRPEVYNVIGEKLARLKYVEFLSVESFEQRLADNEILGKDDVGRYRRALCSAWLDTQNLMRSRLEAFFQ